MKAWGCDDGMGMQGPARLQHIDVCHKTAPLRYSCVHASMVVQQLYISFLCATDEALAFTASR